MAGAKRPFMTRAAGARPAAGPVNFNHEWTPIDTNLKETGERRAGTAHRAKTEKAVWNGPKGGRGSAFVRESPA